MLPAMETRRHGPYFTRGGGSAGSAGCGDSSLVGGEGCPPKCKTPLQVTLDAHISFCISFAGWPVSPDRKLVCFSGVFGFRTLPFFGH